MTNVIQFPSKAQLQPPAMVSYVKGYTYALARLKVRGWKVWYTEYEMLLYHPSAYAGEPIPIECALDMQEIWDNRSLGKF